MSQVAHTARVVQLILDMLEANDQQLVLQQLNKNHGLKSDVARMYSDRELAERYDVHIRTAREWIAKGRLKGCQIDRRWYSRADWMDDFEIGQSLGQKKGSDVGVHELYCACKAGRTQDFRRDRTADLHAKE